jgi:hypothetical protein
MLNKGSANHREFGIGFYMSFNKVIERALGEKPLVETGIVTAKDGYFRKLENMRDINGMD